jgi:hypothetical protein
MANSSRSVCSGGDDDGDDYGDGLFNGWQATADLCVYV